MTQYLWRFVLGFLVISLASCATHSYQPRQSVSAEDSPFMVSGRLAVKVEDKGQYGNFTWQHNLQDDNVEISTPVGSTVAKIVRNSKGVELFADGKVTSSGNIESLTQKTLGYPLPLDNLIWWVRGKIAPQSAYQLDGSGVLQQQGWKIKFYRENEADNLPNRIDMLRDGLSIKIVTHAWQ